MLTDAYTWTGEQKKKFDKKADEVVTKFEDDAGKINKEDVKDFYDEILNA